MKLNTIAMVLTASFLSASAFASPAQDVDVLMPNGQVRVMDSTTAQQYVAVSASHGLPARILNNVEDRQRVIDAPVPPKATAPLAPTPTYERNRPNYRQSPTFDVTTPSGQTVRMTDTPENRQRAQEYQTRAQTGQTAQEYAAQKQLSNYAAQTRDQAQSNEQAIKTNTQTASDNKATMDRVDQEVKAQQQQLHANTAHVQQNSDQTNSNRANIEGNATHVQQNSARIDSNRSSIDNNTAQINQNHTDIEDLREAFEEQAKRVDGAMAQSVANANLAMPYNVGKITTTVALGHSGEANAIAGGFGYRVTESLSVRSSVAYDTATEQVSAGTGVGYEW